MKDNTLNGVSVIVLDFIKHDYINKTLKSISLQTLNKNIFECLIITDNKSYIKTESLVESGLNFKVIEDRPISPLLNLLDALEYCNFNIISIIDNDDEWHEEKLKCIYNAFFDNPSLIATKDSFEPIFQSNKMTIIKKISFRIKFYTKRKVGNVIFNKNSFKINVLTNYGLWHNNSTYSIKKEIILKNTELFSKIKFNTDTVLFFALLMDGGNILALSKILTKFRIGYSSSSVILKDKTQSMNKYELADVYMDKIFKPIMYKASNTDLALLYKLYKLSFLYSKANQHRINDKSINNFKNVVSLFLISKNISIFLGFFYYYLKRIIYNSF